MKKAYLDIETTGLRKKDKVTVVGIYSPGEDQVIQLIKDRDLCSKALNENINRFQKIITFNGKRFDIPFLKRRYDIEENFDHLDICLIKSRVGLKGGLKTIEKKLGITRDE
ncbi:MAG: ribonuclease H-like domain-containing protein, partial [archaeon]